MYFWSTDGSGSKLLFVVTIWTLPAKQASCLIVLRLLSHQFIWRQGYLGILSSQRLCFNVSWVNLIIGLKMSANSVTSKLSSLSVDQQQLFKEVFYLFLEQLAVIRVQNRGTLKMTFPSSGRRFRKYSQHIVLLDKPVSQGILTSTLQSQNGITINDRRPELAVTTVSSLSLGSLGVEDMKVILNYCKYVQFNDCRLPRSICLAINNIDYSMVDNRKF